VNHAVNDLLLNNYGPECGLAFARQFGGVKNIPDRVNYTLDKHQDQ